MKKILMLLLLLLSTLSLTACFAKKDDDASNSEDDKKPVQIEEDFKAFMNKNGALTRNDINEIMSSSTNEEINFDGFNVKNTVISGIDGEYDKFYVWQKGNKIYATPYSSVNYKADEVAYIDLEQLEALTDVSDLLPANVQPADILDEALQMALKDSDIPFTIDLDDILSLITFTYNDFEHLGNGIFQVKNSALFNKVQEFTGGSLKASDIQKLFEESNINLKITVAFDGKHLTGFNVNLSVTENSVTVEVAFELKLTYINDELSSISLSLTSPVANINVLLSNKDDKFEYLLNIEIIYSDSGEKETMIISGFIDDENFKFNFSENGVNLIIVDLTSSGNENTLALSGTITYSTEVYTITSGASVVIPQECIDGESTAVNILEQELNNEKVEVKPYI